MRPTLVFSHANGYPAATYRQLFALWRAAGWQVLAVPQFGHDPRYPVTSNWPRLRDQLIDFIADRAPQGAYLVGHSLGGLLSLQAASKRPELALGLVMLDSPVITGWRAHTVQMLKRSRLLQRLGPGKVSVTRRHEWPSRQAAFDHYAAKSMFARWAPGMLNDTSPPARCGVAATPCWPSSAQSRPASTTPCRTSWARRCAATRCAAR